MAAFDTYGGDGSSAELRTNQQNIYSREAMAKQVQWALFNKTPFMKAIGLEAYGTKAMSDANIFVKSKPQNGIVVEESGRYATGGVIQQTSGSSRLSGRMDARTPELVEGADSYFYSWSMLETDRYIPRLDVDDNGSGEGRIDMLATRQMEMSQQHGEDFNRLLLGSASGPDYGVKGPSVVYSDLPNLISVTQTRTVGAIATTNSFWQNGYTAITDLGGGGDENTPIRLRELMMAGTMEREQYASQTGNYLYVATGGAWLYYNRLMQSDSRVSGNSAVYGTAAKYDAAGIENMSFRNGVMIVDPAVAVPYGATASTEAIYAIQLPEYFISLRKEDMFRWSGWEKAREHDTYDSIVGRITTRMTSGVRNRRPHTVFYNLPNNADISY